MNTSQTPKASLSFTYAELLEMHHALEVRRCDLQSRIEQMDDDMDDSYERECIEAVDGALKEIAKII